MLVEMNFALVGVVKNINIVMDSYTNHHLKRLLVLLANTDSRFITLGCNMAVDSGLYTFNFAKTAAIVGARYSFVSNGMVKIEKLLVIILL